MPKIGVSSMVVCVAILVALPAAAFDDVPSDDPFRGDIDWLAGSGITRGCNPPENTQFCPHDAVTRGQMAAFMVRALDLPAPDEGTPEFFDSLGSVFVDDIARLASSGITRGCNPPDSSDDGPPPDPRFCPDDAVTRGAMAAFLVRALDLPPGESTFTDTTGHTFAGDISSLADAGITRGCNPPVSSDDGPPPDPRFCPDDPVTRAQMAAFLHRALQDGATPPPNPDPDPVDVGVLYVTTRVDTYQLDLSLADSYAHQYELPLINPNEASAVNLGQRELIHVDGLGTVIISELDTGHQVESHTWPSRPDRLDSSPDGRYLAGFSFQPPSNDEPSSLLIVDRATGEIVADLETARGGAWAWTPTSDLVWVQSVGADYTRPDALHVVRTANSDLTSGTPDATVLVTLDNVATDRIRDIAISPDGDRMVYTLGKSLFGLDLTSGAALPHQLTTGPFTHSSPVFSPGGTSLAFVNHNGDLGPLNIIPIHSHEPIHIPAGGGTHEFLLAPDSSTPSPVELSQVVAWEP